MNKCKLLTISNKEGALLFFPHIVSLYVPRNLNYVLILILFYYKVLLFYVIANWSI